MRLTGRGAERGMLDQFVEAIRAGESRALVLSGEPGVGKTALLEYLVERAADCRILRATGVQSEMELAFSALHQLCSPILDHLDGLPAPQHAALRTAFGVSLGAPPDKFLVGLAVLNLLSDVAERRGPEQRVDDRVRQDVGVGVAVEAHVGLDLHAPEHEPPAGGKPVAVIADSGASHCYASSSSAS